MFIQLKDPLVAHQLAGCSYCFLYFMKGCKNHFKVCLFYVCFSFFHFFFLFVHISRCALIARMSRIETVREEIQIFEFVWMCISFYIVLFVMRLSF